MAKKKTKKKVLKRGTPEYMAEIERTAMGRTKAEQAKINKEREAKKKKKKISRSRTVK